MKKIERNESLMVEIVRPHNAAMAAEAGPDGLFDDCPHCERLRRGVRTGDAEKVAPNTWWSVRDILDLDGWWKGPSFGTLRGLVEDDYA